MFSPDGVIPSAFWPDEEGESFTLKESLKPLEPFRDRMLTLHGVCDKVRGDGDNHMRGIGCLLTGVELFPGNIQGGSHTPAGWASGLSIDQEIKNFLQGDPSTRTRFGSLEFGVMVPERADTWTRMVYSGPEQADRADRRPVPDVLQALRPREGPGEPQEHPRRPPGRPPQASARRSAPRTGSCSRSTRPSSARWSRSSRRPTATTSSMRSPSSSRG